MLISENWLRELVNPPKTTQEIADQLTMAGLEVDAIESTAAKFSGVVVAKITAIEPHPDAEKLRICQVFDGSETTQVVCGAPNARAELVVAFAKVGAVLPELKIKKAKLRGVESFGMLCGEPELALGDDDSGLMELAADAPLGEALEAYLALDDNIIEVDLTPNRADCFSMLGVARDLAAINGAALNLPRIDAIPAAHEQTIRVDRQAAAACPRYVGRVISGVDITSPTPLWMQEKLRRAGIRSIDAVVDVTNYVLLELGQPMHAFDLASIDGGLVVRMAEQGETVQLLNDQTVELNADTLVIADATGVAAMAGVMGGSRTAVTAATNSIVLESALFNPVTIAGKARNYGLHTDSSMRFERGVDIAGQERAIERATALLLDICGGAAGPVVVSESAAHIPVRAPIALRRTKISQLTGLAIDDTTVESIFTGLGCAVSATPDGWLISPPSWRFDMSIEADLLEEVARIVGYNNLPTSLPSLAANLPAKPEQSLPLAHFVDTLVDRGFQEVITYSFIAPDLHAAFFSEPAVAVANPISADMAVMRTSLIPGLISTAKYNINRQQKHLKLFESGLTFVAKTEGLPEQETMIAGLLTGDVVSESWVEPVRATDFFDAKGHVEALLAHIDDVRFTPVDIGWLHPGQAAAISAGCQHLGVVGALHPALQKTTGLGQAAFLFELSLAAIASKPLPVFSEISRFPEVRRDLAVVVDQRVTAQTVIDIITAEAGAYFKKLTIFDIYQGKGIDIERKSIGLGLTFQSKSSTLTDDQINQSVERVVSALNTKLGATLRS